MIQSLNESSLKDQAGGKFSTVQVSWFGRYEKSKSPLQSANFSIPRSIGVQTKFSGSKVTWHPLLVQEGVQIRENQPIPPCLPLTRIFSMSYLPITPCLPLTRIFSMSPCLHMLSCLHMLLWLPIPPLMAAPK